MASKIRPLHPEFFTDDAVVSISPLARLMYQGLWMLACDNGHVEDRSRQIKRRVLPDDDCNANELIAEVARVNLITRQDGWITVVATHRWKVDWRYFKTCDHPGCSKPERETQRGPAGDTGGTQRGPSGHPVGTRRAPATDGDGDGDGDGETNSAAASKPGTLANSQMESEFSEWWSSYPRKVSKGAARRAYRAARKKADAPVLLDAVERQRAWLVARGEEFCPHPATWLNGERWSDAPPRPAPVEDPDAWMRRTL